MKVCILTDSTASLKNEYIKENKIEVIPLNVIIDNNEYFDGINITNKEVFEALDNGKNVTTSQPSPQTIIQAYEKLKEEGYTDIISIHISSGLSGTYQSAKVASEYISGINIYVIDTLTCALGVESLISQSLKMLKLGIHPEMVTKRIEEEKEKLKIRIIINDLNRLVSGGRISKAKAIIGNIMRVKPIITLVQGKVEMFKKVRTMKTAIQVFIDELEDDFYSKGRLDVFISHTDSQDLAEMLKKKVEDISSDINVTLCKEISPVVAIHIGHNGVGVVWS